MTTRPGRSSRRRRPRRAAGRRSRTASGRTRLWRGHPERVDALPWVAEVRPGGPMSLHLTARNAQLGLRDPFRIARVDHGSSDMA